MATMRALILSVLLLCGLAPLALPAQVSAADYARAAQLGERFQGLVVNVAERPTWLDANRFWYRKSVTGGNEFILVDLRDMSQAAAFDHQRMARGLNAVMQQQYTAVTLPFATFTFDGAEAIRFVVAAGQFRCTITEYSCARTGPAPSAPGQGGGRGSGAAGAPFVGTASLAALFGTAHDDHEHPMEGPWVDDDGLEAEVLAQRAQAAQLQQRPSQSDSNVVRSPDGSMEAFIRNYNIFIRPVASSDSARGRTAPGAPRRDADVQLSWDGSEGRAYVLGPAGNRSLQWSPDSRKIAAYRVTPGYQRMVRFIESSPSDQLQPKFSERYYQKPGDPVAIREPALFDVATRQQLPISNALFPNAFALSAIQWWKDSRGFTFEYNQRGHQVYRVIEVNAVSGEARALVSEEPKTFYSYRPTSEGLGDGGGTRLRRDLADGREILWLSERDGWKHLYLYDGRTGKVKNQVTRGNFVVRAVNAVDTASRTIRFAGSGRDAGQDPYFVKYYRINFDGTGLVSYTPEDGTHTITWSPDSAHYVDSWTRVDLPAVTVLKRASDQKVVMALETGDASALVAAGYQMAEPFVAKGRDGTTDIHGVIFRPTNFDPSRRYPVIEQIYAGPQGSFVPKSFSVGGAPRTLAEHGFIVVQIDGMGTANRSKAFHDVAWRNLGDAGFPDRILWHKAAAARYPWYDISRVGIYGTSAGGQNALGALLFHPGFYHAAFSAAGCHDNRMDKIWWNEQWMGWPIGPHYAAASNVDHAHKLQGDLLLVVGELDTNVDPASTYQVVNALVAADKMFDLLVLPGAGHTNGGPYGVRKMTDFFVRSLHRIEPPARNSVD
jgi:dipeptidyl aminopeptidase/acylaminoacyl peptidase